MYLAVHKHDVLVIILKQSDQCFHSIGWIHRPNYLLRCIGIILRNKWQLTGTWVRCLLHWSFFPRLYLIKCVKANHSSFSFTPDRMYHHLYIYIYMFVYHLLFTGTNPPLSPKQIKNAKYLLKSLDQITSQYTSRVCISFWSVIPRDNVTLP